MPVDTQRDCTSSTGWTVDTLKEYLCAKLVLYERLLDEHSLRNDDRFESINDAVKMANGTSEKSITKSEAVAFILVICAIVTVLFNAFVYFTTRH